VNFLRQLALQGGDSSLLNVIEIMHVPDMPPSLFPSCSGYELISTQEVATLASDFSIQQQIQPNTIILLHKQ